VAFEAAPKYHMDCTGVRTTFSKNLSVYFTVDTVVTSPDILFSFYKAEIDIDEIVLIQRKGFTHSWVAKATEQALSVLSITIAECQVFIGDTENRTALIKIYECPDEMPDTFVIGCLSAFATVLSFHTDLLADNIRNGIRIAQIRLTQPIPSSHSIAGELVFITYPGQLCTCHKWGEEGHVATTSCKAHCFNCWQAGHHVDQCEKPEYCQICDKMDHRTCQCLFYVYVANLFPSTPGIVSYASAAKTNPPEPAKTNKRKNQVNNKLKSQVKSRIMHKNRINVHRSKMMGGTISVNVAVTVIVNVTASASVTLSANVIGSGAGRRPQPTIRPRPKPRL